MRGTQKPKPSLTAILAFCIVLLSATVSAQSGADTLNRLDPAGKKHGYWKKYEKDTLRYEGRFDHGIPVGTFVYYFPDGDIKAISHFSKKGTYTNTTLYYTANKVWATGFYLNEKKDSLWKYYDYNGLLMKEERYSSGTPHGTWVTYYGNGKPSEVTVYVKGVKQGTWTRYFESGAVMSKGSYVSGKLEGVMSIYYPNGKLKTSGRYANDLRIGTWMVYDQEGKMVAKEEYNLGILTKTVNLVP